jgi:hypothetical protein
LTAPTLILLHLSVLNDDGVFWITHSKESLSLRVVKKLPKAADRRILRNELVVLKNKDSRANLPQADAAGFSPSEGRRISGRCFG